MRFSDEGIVVENTPTMENRYLLKVFSKTHGMIRCMTPKKVDIGQRIFFDYAVKDCGQIGFVKISQNIVLLFSYSLSPFVSSTCHLLSQYLPEMHPYENFYNETLLFLSQQLERSKGFYIWFEELLLKHLGFGLSLEECAISQTKQNLIYVSPKTGRAISQSVGARYHDTLILLPSFMSRKEYEDVDESDFVLGLKLTGYFLQKHLGPLPQIRRIL